MIPNNQWLEFLKTQNAQFENNCVAHFGNRVAELQAGVTRDVLCELSHLGFISASGDEAQSFLQNQLSNDVKKVTEQFSQLNAYCTAKGRALALFRLFQLNQTYLLQLPVESIDAALKRLQMFVLMTKVKLQDASAQFVAFGLAGANARQRLSVISQEIPEQDNQCVASDDLLICKIPGQQPRYMILASTTKAIDAWNQLKSETTLCSHHVWSYLDIHAGLPQIYQGNVEAFVPQMLNLHSVDGISFQKGCYPGQEVVARMHFLGKLKRRMYLTHVDSEKQPNPGDLVFAKDDPSKEGIGRVVDSQASPDGGFDMLTVMQIASADAGPAFLHSPQGPELTFRELPYEVTLERDDK